MLPQSQRQPRFATPVWSRIGKLHVGNYWEFYSLKLGRTVSFTSDLECDHAVGIESDPEVEAYCEEPLVVQAFVYGKLRSSRLDAWVQWKDGRQEFREVKHAKDIAASMVEEGGDLDVQLRVQQSWADRTGEPYQLVTDEVIRAKPFHIQNWKQILHLLKVNLETEINPAHGGAVVHTLQSYKGTLPLWALHERLGQSIDAQILRTIIYRKLHSGEFTADLSGQRLTDRTLISLRKP